MRRRFRAGLLPRAAVALAAVGLLPVLIASFGLARFNRDALLEQVLRTHIVTAHTAADRAVSLLALHGALAHGAAAAPELADARSPAAGEALARDLAAWSRLGVLAIALRNAAGEEIVRAQVKGERGRVAAALAAGGAGPAVPGQSPLVLRAVAPRADGGSLVLVSDGSPLAEVVHPVGFDDQATLLIAERGGRVVLGPMATLDGLPPALVRNALSGRVEGAGRYHTGEETIVGAFVAVPDSDWVVLSLQPSSAAEAVAARLRRQTTYALAAAGLLIAGLSFGAWAFLVRPIRALAAAQRGLVKGGGSGSGGDEIADLQSTFELLRRSLADRRTLDDVFLGRYQVIEALGTGAMGTVFRGWDPRLKRPVALKTVRLSGALDAAKRRELVATLSREAVTVARLSHPNLVAVYDLEDAPETTFIAMEYVDGVNLEGLLKRGPLAAAAVVPLGAAIAHGLAAAHAQGIVHRDVKPANVLLGRDGAIKVSDFGIAGLLAATAEEADTLFGTPGYVPPESLRGEGHGPAGDLFAFGVLLYHALTQRMPFAGSDVDDVLRSTLFGPVRPLTPQVPDLPPELGSLIAHLLEREVELRPSSAAAVAAELDRIALARGLRWRFDAGIDEAETAELGTASATSSLHARWLSTTRLGRGVAAGRN